MLHSKYLTQEGMEIMLKTLYKDGWRYIFQGQQRGRFYVSKEEPHYHRNEVFAYCDGDTISLNRSLNVFLADALEGRNYIEIADHIDIVDWSTVKVDTPVLVKSVEDGEWKRRYFAGYDSGHVYTWDGGATSWSTDNDNQISWWDYAKLSED